MTLRARLNRLASRRGTQAYRPEVTCIFIRGVYAVDRDTGEVTGADTASAMVWTPKDGRLSPAKIAKPRLTLSHA